MKRVAIVYESRHHANTQKIVDTISSYHSAEFIDASKQPHFDLSEYDLIGFASGIDFGKFYDSVERFLEENLPQNKQIFFLYTCAKPSSRFTSSIRVAAQQKNAVILGEYGCKGYNTYGPWKLIGGMNKNHPTPIELEEAVSFYKLLLHL